MGVSLLGFSDAMCSPNSVCQNNPSVNTPDANNDLDLDSGADTNAAWAGIAVVIVVVVVGAGVWFGIRRRRRARGGHSSVDTGGNGKLQFTFSRRFFSFWRRQPSSRSPEQPISVEGEMEVGRSDEGKERRNSLASNLKRTSTGTVDIDPPAAKLGTPYKETGAGQYPMVPIHHAQLQSTETITSAAEPLPRHDASQNPRDSASSHRSSLSRLSVPPPGLGPPIHRPDSDSPSHTVPSSS